MLKASPKYKDKALNISGYGDTGENIGKVEKIKKEISPFKWKLSKLVLILQSF